MEILEQISKKRLIELCKKKKFRMNNLYKIQNENGQVVTFQMRKAQEDFFDNVHKKNVILKARQLGFSTLIDLWLLDEALFRSNTQCAIIAQTKADVQEIFEKKIRFAWDNLRPDLKSAFKETSKTANKLAWNNGSSIRVATSVRSSTLQGLHISEFGYISTHFPERAREIVTGCLNTLHEGSTVFIESTAKGDEGKFFEYCEMAKKLEQQKAVLSSMDYKFFFFPWWKEPSYFLDEKVYIPQDLQKYFEDLQYKQLITLSQQQKNWYVKKWEQNGDDTFAEFPSYPEEAFKSTKEGRYFSTILGKVRARGQITIVPYDESLPVCTGWDLGLSDATAIWFAQKHGIFLRMIDYYENNDESLYHYANIIKSYAYDRGYYYDRHFLPHDAARRSFERRDKFTRQEILEKEHGLQCTVTKAIACQADGIELIRKSIPMIWFDEEKTEKGIKALDNYKREFDHKRGTYADKPFHNWASHGTKAMETLLLGYTMFSEGETSVSAEEIYQMNANHTTGYF